MICAKNENLKIVDGDSDTFLRPKLSKKAWASEIREQAKNDTWQQFQNFLKQKRSYTVWDLKRGPNVKTAQ